MTDKNTYLVYWGDIDGEIAVALYGDLASARAAATELAKEHPGQEFYIAALMTTLRAETVVKEV